MSQAERGSAAEKEIRPGDRPGDSSPKKNVSTAAIVVMTKGIQNS